MIASSISATPGMLCRRLLLVSFITLPINSLITGATNATRAIACPDLAVLCPKGSYRQYVTANPHNGCKLDSCNLECCDPSKKGSQCRKGCKCCGATGEWVGSNGDGKTFTCNGVKSNGGKNGNYSEPFYVACKVGGGANHTCKKDLKVCSNGTKVARDPTNTCKFPKCKITKESNSTVACTQDAKLCSDGSSVGRDPSKNCQFSSCPTLFSSGKQCTKKNKNLQGSNGQNASIAPTSCPTPAPHYFRHVCPLLYLPIICDGCQYGNGCFANLAGFNSTNCQRVCRGGSECTNSGEICDTSYNSDCDSDCGDTGCTGICVVSDGKHCGGSKSSSCASGYKCVDKKGDCCSSQCGGKNCDGICIAVGETDVCPKSNSALKCKNDGDHTAVVCGDKKCRYDKLCLAETAGFTQVECRSECSLVFCPAARCINGEVLHRAHNACCPTCVQKNATACTNVSCSRPSCKKGESLVVSDGKCCPTCQSVGNGKPDCSAIMCALPMCEVGSKMVTRKGSCCPVCEQANNSTTTKNSCASVNCPKYKCLSGSILQTPNGECCPKCQNCTSVRCELPMCAVGSKLVPQEGSCCPICVSGNSTNTTSDCASVVCPKSKCNKGSTLETRKGECCPKCQKGGK